MNDGPDGFTGGSGATLVTRIDILPPGLVIGGRLMFFFFGFSISYLLTA